MKKLKKITMLILISIIMLFMTIPLSYATEGTNFSVLLTGNATVEQGGTLEVTIKIGNFVNIGEGVSAFLGDLEFDTTKLTVASIESLNDWDKPEYKNNKILTAKGSKITEEEAIIKITFNVNSDAALGTTTIAVRNPEAANSNNDYVGIEGILNVEIQEKTQQPGGDGSEGSNPEGSNPEGSNPGGSNPEGSNPEGSNPEGSNPEGSNPEGSNPEGSNPEGSNPEGSNPEGSNPEGSNPEGSNPEQGKDNTVADTKIPDAGLAYIGIGTIAIVVVIGIVCYKKYSYYNI